MNNPLRILKIGDVHLGNRLVSTESIIKNLNEIIVDNEKMADISIIFFGGDVFDEALFLQDSNIEIIQLWIVRVLNICKKWDICLRVLEGTPSHDRQQSKQFQILNTALGIGTDVKHINTLSIEYIDKFNINVLYVPDEWRACNKQTEEEVEKLLQDNNLTQVDYALMHGNFQHQLPYNVKNHNLCHDTDFYLRIVKKYILISHIHVASQYERIFAPGSIDRLAHGEEGEKGFLYIESYHNSFENDKIIFKANKNAARFLTINIIGLSKYDAELCLDDVIKRAEINNEDYHIPIFIRVKCEKNDLNEDIISTYRQSYVLIKWSIKTEIKDVVTNSNYVAPTIFKPIPINENTIFSLIKKRLECIDIDDLTLTNTLNTLNTLKAL